LIARIQAEAAKLARELKHNAVIELHILLAWLLVVEELGHQDKDVVRANLKESLRNALVDGKVGPAKGPSLNISPGGKAYLLQISQSSTSLELFRELLAKSGISEKEVLIRTSKQTGESTEELSELDQALAALNAMTGLADVKQKMNDLVAIEKVRRVQEAQGIKTVRSGLNFIFSGDPGTGKTTVARLVGDIYRALGLLSSGHLIEVTQKDLIAKYLGQTAIKTQAVIKSALGGVLFIDEAYSLAQETWGYGAEAISTLVAGMENNRDDLAVIVAGYTEEMIPFIDANPGLKSRFTRQFYFENYSTSELFQMFEKSCADLEITLGEEAGVRVKRHLDFNPTGGSNGNGRYVRKFFEAVFEKSTLRLAAGGTVDAKQPIEFKPEDIPETLGYSSSPITIEEALAELDGMIGLQSVKDKMREIVAVQGARIALEKANRPTQPPALNLVFSGPPGTGKTTVARIVARIYQALGALPRGHIVEVGRENLVGQYVGQTAPKVVKRVEEAMGGVLFIDEAYTLTLTKNGPYDFGSEAVAALLTQMENKRGTFAIIAAGYKDEMQHFLESNPGLKSRMDHIIEFEDYKPQELLEIFLQLAKSNQVSVSAQVQTKLISHLENNQTGGVEGNGRYVRRLYDAASMKVAQRASKVDFDLEVLGKFISDDIPDSISKAKVQNPIGFQA
jgi:SpoVK/Ycf46/Vps4 family AAA+-type ATPase